VSQLAPENAIPVKITNKRNIQNVLEIDSIKGRKT